MADGQLVVGIQKDAATLILRQQSQWETLISYFKSEILQIHSTKRTLGDYLDDSSITVDDKLVFLRSLLTNRRTVDLQRILHMVLKNTIIYVVEGIEELKTQTPYPHIIIDCFLKRGDSDKYEEHEVFLFTTSIIDLSKTGYKGLWTDCYLVDTLDDKSVTERRNNECQIKKTLSLKSCPCHAVEEEMKNLFDNRIRGLSGHYKKVKILRPADVINILEWLSINIARMDKRFKIEYQAEIAVRKDREKEGLEIWR
jgi:hypothetical protein